MRLLAAVLLAAAFAVQASAAKPSRYKVASVTGGVLTADGKAVAAEGELSEGAKVRLDKGKAVLELGDEGRLMLTGPAEIKLGKREVGLVSGALLSVLPRLRGNFSVSTPLAVAAVRGTEFFLEVREDGRTYLCLCEGALEVSAAPGLSLRKTMLRSKHHGSYIYSKIGKRVDRGPWRMENHSDAEIGGLK
ncbi:hypothetical protein EPO15_13430 [bacterium]|nr:MAG: hypothetical protein EPO15_13430 [bacterium]